MVILSAPRTLESTRSISLHPNIFPDMNRQFLPMLRYHNPKLEIGTLPAESDNAATMAFHDDSVKASPDVGTGFSLLMQWILDSDREKSIDLLSKRQTSDR